MADHEDGSQLKDCIETVQRLEEENEQLRRAAGAFGQLAERLNQALKEERRNHTDRRQSPRPSQDRRFPSA
jgi:hypothetical protein